MLILKNEQILLICYKEFFLNLNLILEIRNSKWQIQYGSLIIKKIKLTRKEIQIFSNFDKLIICCFDENKGHVFFIYGFIWLYYTRIWYILLRNKTFL